MSEMFPKINVDCLSKATTTNFKQYDSKTNFKLYLITYLEYYNDKKLTYWIDLAKKHDMSSAK